MECLYWVDWSFKVFFASSVEESVPSEAGELIRDSYDLFVISLLVGTVAAHYKAITDDA